jgi:thymine-DNA glycosylase
VLAPDLLILFVGLNPGVQTARSGHAYAHPSNLFWKLLYSSGITPVPCRPEEDRTLPERFSLGNTNIVARPSRNGAELSKAEMDAGVAILEEKARRWRPEVVCIVGKSIWESIFRVWKGRNLAKGEFEYGWQAERMGAVPAARDSAAVKVKPDVRKWLVEAQVPPKGGSEKGEDGNDANERLEREGEREGGGEEKVDGGPWEGSRIFVATTTSGLAASLRPEEKERIWKVLGDWCVQRRKERANDKAGET